MKRTGALLLTLTLLLSACSGSASSNVSSGAADTGILATEALNVGYTPFSGLFSPFYAEYANDWDAVELTQIHLLYSDRSGAAVYKGIAGEIRPYNGVNYTYYGPADLTVTENPDGTVQYDFTLREDLLFSDGTHVTVDDLIFSLYVLCDPSYDGPNRLCTMPIEGVTDYRHGEADHISGIQRTGDYTLRVVTERMDLRVIYYLGSVCIAPMHYYGDASLYDYDSSSFGFPKGDLSGVKDKTACPMGAGPYRLVDYSDGVITYEANESYYLGAPQTRYIRFVEIPENLWWEQADGLLEGSLDVTYLNSGWGYWSEEWENAICSTLTRLLVNEGQSATYRCIGINCNTVRVGSDSASEASRALRKAFCTLFAAYRQSGLDTARELGLSSIYAVVDYPVSGTSWLVPGKDDPNYAAAYAVDAAGDDIYNDDMTREDRCAAAATAALSYFELAGYTVSEGTLTAAPDGAALEYEIQIMALVSESTGRICDPIYHTLTAVQAVLADMGITLTIVNTAEWEEVAFPEPGTCDMWVGNWSDADMNGLYFGNDCRTDWYAAVDPETHLYEVYCSSSGVSTVYPEIDRHVYGVSDPELDSLLLDARATTDQTARKALYAKCLNIIMDWACEVPFYQGQEALVFHQGRVNAATMPEHITANYGWLREIHYVEKVDGV